MQKISMRQMREGYLKLVDADIKQSAADFRAAEKYIHDSSATFTRGNLQFLCVPKLFSPEAFKVIEKSLLTMHGILDKVISRYLADAAYRKLFPFSETLEKLILLPCGYKQKLPIARLDIFFNEDDFSFKFCEFNADGASAMNEDREIANGWRNTTLWRDFSRDFEMRSFELFDSWVTEFLSIYTEFAGSDKKPRVAIVDFLDIGTKSEFKVFKEAFERRGVETVIAEITKMKYTDGKLYDEHGNQIDAVYRRAVTSECMEKIDRIGDFIRAVEEQAVCIVGAFRTQVIHDKNLFVILKMLETKAFLTDEENEFIKRHIPETHRLERGAFDIDEVFKNKNKWLIKPADRYGSMGVVTGAGSDKEKWQKSVLAAIDNGFVLQEYCPPHKTTNLFFDSKGEPHFNEYKNMTGIFLYNGKVAGLYSRMMLDRVTTKQREGRVVCSLVAEKKQI